MAMSADPIGQLLRREGHLPLTIEDRPRLDALLAAHPALLAAIRESHALASRHFPAGSDVCLRVMSDPDVEDAGDFLVFAIRSTDDWDIVQHRRRAFFDAMIAGHPQLVGSTIVFRISQVAQ